MERRYRALDLCDGRGNLCGKILADTGIDVIKVERPDGDPSRNNGPFYHDNPHSECSLSWFAFNTGKKSITLNLDTVDGRRLLASLVKSSDFLIESFPPGHMAGMGLDYPILQEANPGLIYVSISGFGQSGPYKDFKAPDIVVSAMSGLMNLTGEPGREPLRMGIPQAYLHAGVEAAIGALFALWHRESGGEGQHVDVSAQECLMLEMVDVQQVWDLLHTNTPRLGTRRLWGQSQWKWIFLCKDGYVCFPSYNPAAISARSRKLIVEWMDAEGMADDYIKSFDWMEIDTAKLPPEEVRRIEPYFARFLAKKTKKELLEKTMELGLVLAPLISIEDALASLHHKDRGFWVDLEHPNLGAKLAYPGAPYVSTAKGYQVKERAPLIGEHNEQIYGELGLGKDDLVRLKGIGVL